METKFSDTEGLVLNYVTKYCREPIFNLIFQRLFKTKGELIKFTMLLLETKKIICVAQIISLRVFQLGSNILSFGFTSEEYRAMDKAFYNFDCIQLTDCFHLRMQTELFSIGTGIYCNYAIDHIDFFNSPEVLFKKRLREYA